MSGEQKQQTDVIPIHQWTDESGRVLLVKCVAAGGQSYRGFQWPRSGPVRAPVASREPNCRSGGLFGWPWGLNLGCGKEPDFGGDWIVFSSAPEDVIDLGGKAKAVGECTVLYYGTWHGALEYTRALRLKWIHANARGSASVTGWSGAASLTGPDGVIEIGPQGAGVVTAESFTWIAHPGRAGRCAS